MTSKLMPVYNKAPISFDRGDGSWLFGSDGATYLDCVCGIATNALGHAHPALVAALEAQAKKLWHLSNIYEIPGQDELAARLTGACFADAAFFTNSGAEAVECALKAARRYHAQRGASDRIDIIGFEGAFHGRTYAAINAAGNPSFLDGFGPRLPGYVRLSLDDRHAIRAAIAAPSTAALIVEPVQGEGGARALSGEWLRAVRQWCSDAGVLLIYDEIQSGMGRTGRLFAHQWFEECEPDIMTIAKALGGGFPIGACLATDAVAQTMTFGAHGSTFGGNPLAMAVAGQAFELLSDPALMKNVAGLAQQLNDGLAAIAAKFEDIVADVRGKGLLIGVKLHSNNREFMAHARSRHLLVAGGGDNCVRLLPALNMTRDEAQTALVRFEESCELARAAMADAA